MRLKGVVLTFFVSLMILSSCAEETCPATTAKSEYYFKKKVKVKHHAKKKPTPSLIHITRVNYKPYRHGN